MPNIRASKFAPVAGQSHMTSFINNQRGNHSGPSTSGIINSNGKRLASGMEKENDGTETPPKKGKSDNAVGVSNDRVYAKLEEILNIAKNNQSDIRGNKDHLYEVDYRLNALEQANLNASIEINGLRIPDNADSHIVMQSIISFMQTSSIAMKDHELVDAFTVPRVIGGTQSKVIIAVFLHPAIKGRIMREKMMKDKGKQVTVFFNNVLTKINRAIFMTARKCVKERKLFRAWSLNGEVYVKKSEQEDRIKVSSMEHLEYIVYGNDERNDQTDSPLHNEVVTPSQ
jgi:hypothetical protein